MTRFFAVRMSVVLTLGLGQGAASAQNATGGKRVTSPVSAKREYQKRFDALAADDLAGHFVLAKWCQDKRHYDLLERQCQHVLKLKPDHSVARIMLDLARQELAKRGPAPSGRPRTGRGPAGAKSVLVSAADIQALRFAEIQNGRQPRVQVKFKKKFVRKFADQMLQEARFDSQERTAFLKMKPPQQLGVILQLTDDEHKDKIELRSDPAMFVEFRRRVLPIIRSGCATSACHGSVKAPVFRLYTDRGKSVATAYTNFLVLDRLHVGGRPLIDRDNPSDSLLLAYLLPAKQVERTHPSPPKINSVAKSVTDLKYRRIAAWIEQYLRSPHPEYAVSWRPPGAAPPSPTAPGTAPPK